MAEGLTVAALLEREDTRDVLVANSMIGATSLADIPRGSRVGTSSLRRRAQLAHARPDLEAVELRGNVPTRIRKVDEGIVHAAILAAAGLHRLEARQHITAYLDAPEWLHAAGQGAIAVQTRLDDARILAIVASLSHRATEISTRAERAFLAALEGGCQVPIGAAVITADGLLTLHGLIASLDGRTVLRGSCAIDPDAPEHGGESLAESLRGRGAAGILAEIPRQGRIPSPQPE
jgi:hydroxymethylbilane synthase